MCTGKEKLIYRYVGSDSFETQEDALTHIVTLLVCHTRLKYCLPEMKIRNSLCLPALSVAHQAKASKASYTS